MLGSTLMPQWFVELDGDPFDVEEFPFWFPEGVSPCALKEGDKVLITSSEFEGLHEPGQVQELAETLLDELFATIRLLQAGVRRPTLGTVWRQSASGEREGFALVAAHITGRAKLRATFATNSPNTPQTQARSILRAARSDRHLHVAMTILALPYATWPHLYRCVEEIEQSLGSGVVEAGLCDRPTIRRFRRTINTGETGGLDARHRLGNAEPLSDPMSLVEAMGLVTGLLSQALKRRAVSDAA